MSMNQSFSKNDSTTVSNNGPWSHEACSLNRSGLQRGAARMSYTCGYCDRSCIYHVIQCTFTIGIIANVIVVFRVARDRKLRNPTFVSIAACAVADICFLIVDLLLSFEGVILTFTCNYPGKLRTKHYMAMKVVAWFTANGHVTLLAVVRFIILVYPLKANVCLSTRRVLLLSGLVWLLAFLSSYSIGLLGFLIDIPRQSSQEFHLVQWTTVYLIPVVTTATLHLVKIYKIGQTTTVTTNKQAKRPVQAIARMVLLVIFIATVLPFPFVLDGFLQSLGINVYGSRAVALHMRPISRILVLLNHSINPVMYAFVSNAFRMSFKRMLGLDRNASNIGGSSSGTRIATLS